MIVCDDCMDATVWETLVRVALRSFWLLERGWNWKEMSLEGRRWRKVRRSLESGRHELSRMVWAMRLAVGVLAAVSAIIVPWNGFLPDFFWELDVR